jgi:hypothetical protein
MRQKCAKRATGERGHKGAKGDIWGTPETTGMSMAKTVESLKHDEAMRKNIPTAMRPRMPADVADARIL